MLFVLLLKVAVVFLSIGGAFSSISPTFSPSVKPTLLPTVSISPSVSYKPTRFPTVSLAPSEEPSASQAPSLSTSPTLSLIPSLAPSTAESADWVFNVAGKADLLKKYYYFTRKRVENKYFHLLLSILSQKKN